MRDECCAQQQRFTGTRDIVSPARIMAEPPCPIAFSHISRPTPDRRHSPVHFPTCSRKAKELKR